MVHTVICNPSFVGNGFDVTVTLSNPAMDIYNSGTLFKNFVQATTLPPTGSTGPFTTFQLDVGPNVDPTLRCSIKDTQGNFIFGTRGTNRDTSFSDSDKGPWQIEGSSAVIAEVVCDPATVANNRPA